MGIHLRGAACAKMALVLAAALCLPHAGLAGDGLADHYDGNKAGVRPAIIPIRITSLRENAEGLTEKDDLPTPEEILDKRVRVLEDGTSSAATRRKAIASLPLEKLSQNDRKRVERILKSIDLYRALPKLEFEVEPSVYRYFAQNPDVAVGIWRVMRISKFDVRRTGPDTFSAKSGDGTEGKLEFLYRSDRESLVLCHGLYKSPFLPKTIRAEALFHFKTEHAQRDDGTPVARHAGTMFVAFPSQTVGTVARIVSPVSNLIMDRNFREISLFVHMMSLAMQKQPSWVKHLADSLDGVPDAQKNELLKLTAQVFVESRRRELARSLEDE